MSYNSRMKSRSLALCLVLFGFSALTHSSFGAIKPKAILSDPELLRAAGIPVLFEDAALKVGFAQITEAQEERLSHEAHKRRRCGGFEALGELPSDKSTASALLESLREMEARNRAFLTQKRLKSFVSERSEITAALTLVKETEVESTIKWLSNFPTRFHKGTTPNAHVDALKARIEEMVKDAPHAFEVSLVAHTATPQKSLRVRIPGSTRPNEIVVLGGHLDSINMSGGHAPGADDNASGSSNLLEAIRVLLQQKQPERTLEFFFYAGEEGGLLGSAEIAKDYKTRKLDVIGVLQLDMTLFPGAGEMTLGSMTDFTSAWMRAYLADLNSTYLGFKIVEDRCGYGCSDHASWHRQGFPAIMPFEATFNTMNRDIHTTRDTVTPKSSFKHSTHFARLALALALDLGNSSARQP